MRYIIRITLHTDHGNTYFFRGKGAGGYMRYTPDIDREVYLEKGYKRECAAIKQMNLLENMDTGNDILGWWKEYAVLGLRVDN